MINSFGNIYEGTFNENCKIYGFCVSFLGSTNEIEVGWYNNNRIHGNYMKINASDMSTIESGWYRRGKYLRPMDAHSGEQRIFRLEDIFPDDP